MSYVDTARTSDVVYEALGITDEVEMYGLKGSKKKKGKKLDEDFIVRYPTGLYVMTVGLTSWRSLQPDLKPIILKEVPKVISAMRQTQSKKVLVKLLMRIKVRWSRPSNLSDELMCLRS